MKEHGIPFKYLGDALRLRNECVRALEEADNETDPEEKRKLLTFIVGGGGFSGVECIAELHDFLVRAVAAYRNLRKTEVRCILLQSRSHPSGIGQKSCDYAHAILEKRGVEIRLNTRLVAVSADGVLVQSAGAGKQDGIASRTVVVTVPAAPHPLVSSLPCALDRGRIRVTQNLDVPGVPGVWAVGDCAAVPQRDGITSPPTAQHALRQARTCARNILATIRGEPLQPFAFTGLGKLASLGRHSAVAEVFGFRMKGFLAWLFWRSVYLSKFPGLDRRIRIMMDWLLDLWLPRDITQIRLAARRGHSGAFPSGRNDLRPRRLRHQAVCRRQRRSGGAQRRQTVQRSVPGKYSARSHWSRTAPETPWFGQRRKSTSSPSLDRPFKDWSRTFPVSAARSKRPLGSMASTSRRWTLARTTTRSWTQFGRHHPESGLVMLTLSFVDHDPKSGALPPQMDALRRGHSITSSARPSSIDGTSRLSALAVFRLMINSELGRRLHRQIGRLLALEDVAGAAADLTEPGVRDVCS